MLVDTPPRTGLVMFAKRECPTCRLVLPVVAVLAREAEPIAVYVQDDPGYLDGAVDDGALEQSFRFDVETVPTLIRLEDGREVDRTFGWSRLEWARVARATALGAELPGFQPGCGSKSREPGVFEHLVARYGNPPIASRRIEVGPWEDPVEQCFERGWSDGLPLVPPTDERIVRMLSGTSRAADEIVGHVPPNLSPCTVEKVAINAVMAGCKAEYMPVVLAALETALDPLFTMHGLLCTTCFSGPIIVVNGPVARAIGMNSGVNALGQGNRANATIGRAVQLVVRNVGGGRPQREDRAAHGQPGKLSACFAERLSDSPWAGLAQDRGVPAEQTGVTLLAAEAPRLVIDQLARTPEELCASLGQALEWVGHRRQRLAFDALVVIGPEHGRILREAGWDRPRTTEELFNRSSARAGELVRGADGVAEGIEERWVTVPAAAIPKFASPDRILLAHAGGDAGLFSMIYGSWVSGEIGSQPVTRSVEPWL
jgi:thiol-disulfide isomerase/thioredoxin